MPLRDVRSRFMPYCIRRLDNGEYVVLNREYKPLGFGHGQYEYSDYPISVSLKGLTPRIAEKLSHNDNRDLDKIFLYNDDCVPTHSTKHMNNYLKRLAILGRLRIQEKR